MNLFIIQIQERMGFEKRARVPEGGNLGKSGKRTGNWANICDKEQERVDRKLDRHARQCRKPPEGTGDNAVSPSQSPIFESPQYTPQKYPEISFLQPSKTIETTRPESSGYSYRLPVLWPAWDEFHKIPGHTHREGCPKGTPILLYKGIQFDFYTGPI